MDQKIIVHLISQILPLRTLQDEPLRPMSDLVNKLYFEAIVFKKVFSYRK